jgi:hypothetical protein
MGTGLDAIVVNAVYPERFSKADAERLRTAAENGHRPEATGALRAALTEYERARSQRTHLRRLRREAQTSVLTLPFLFEPHVGLDQWRRLGRELERKL